MSSPDAGAGVGQTADAGPDRDQRDETRLRELADEQAALRRVATLVASGARPAEVFSAVADELGRLTGVEATFVSRLDQPFGPGGEPAGSITVVGSYGLVSDQVPAGFQVRLHPGLVTAAALRTGRPALVNGEPPVGHPRRAGRPG